MSNIHRHDTVVQRRRTSPHAKWLINEAAALRGELVRVVARQKQLAQREAAIRKTLAALELVAAPLPVPAGVSAPVVVNPHNRYGSRGRLTNLILDRLQDAWPRGVDIHSLVDWVATCSRMDLASMADRTDCRRSVGTRLRHLSAQGRVERLDSIGHEANGAGVWRLAGKKGPTLEELQRRATAVAGESAGGI